MWLSNVPTVHAEPFDSDEDSLVEARHKASTSSARTMAHNPNGGTQPERWFLVRTELAAREKP